MQIVKLGQFTSSCVANVDQTPLPFTFTNGSTYKNKGAKTVWYKGELWPRQTSVYSTAYFVCRWHSTSPHVKPMVIFRGIGKLITLTERLKYDQRVGVRFQENAWCDEPCMVNWVCNYWNPCVEGKMMLLLDNYKAQKTPSVLTMLNDECSTITVGIPPGCTSLVQPLDVVFNAPFKEVVYLSLGNFRKQVNAPNFSKFVCNFIICFSWC